MLVSINKYGLLLNDSTNQLIKSNTTVNTNYYCVGSTGLKFGKNFKIFCHY